MGEVFYEQIDSNNFPVDEWLSLFIDCFGQRHFANKDWVNWFFLDYKKDKTFVVKDSDRIVASYGLYPMDIVFDSQLFEGYLCHNGMTSPEYSGMGLFTKLGKYGIDSVMKENVILFGIPNENAIYSHRKVGWQEMENIPFYEKTSFNRLEHSPFKPVLYFSEEDNETLLSFMKKYKFYVKKDHSFLNWRFVKNPKWKYYIFKSDPFNSYVVLKVYQDDLQKVHVVDYGYEDDNDFLNILNFVNNFCYELDVDVLNLWCLNSKECDLMLENGFVKSNFSNRLILHSNINFLDHSMDNWHITLADNDVF